VLASACDVACCVGATASGSPEHISQRKLVRRAWYISGDPMCLLLSRWAAEVIPSQAVQLVDVRSIKSVSRDRVTFPDRVLTSCYLTVSLPSIGAAAVLTPPQPENRPHMSSKFQAAPSWL
jgi:hypothetical protein